MLLISCVSSVKDIVCKLYSCGSCERREISNAAVHQEGLSAVDGYLQLAV